MNVYTCQIDLKKDAQALPIVAALESWMSHLQTAGMVATSRCCAESWPDVGQGAA